LVQKAQGRGAWVHPNGTCLAQALTKGFARSFHTGIATSLAELEERIRGAACRRVEGLVSAARRAKALAIGATAVEEAWQRGEVAAVVVATDARSAAETRAVIEAVQAGKALGWGTKDWLGRATGREEVAVVAVTDAGFAQALSTAVRLSQYPLPGLERPQSLRAAASGGPSEV
jgi:ribosomal protein L7Ae-like RNA K-turn-binding protein